MTALERIDSAIFGATDAALLWVWNEWGWSWRRVKGIANAGAVGAMALMIYDGSILAAVFLAVIGIGHLLLGLVYAYVSAEVHNRAQANRLSRYRQFIRYLWVLFAALDLAGEWADVAGDLYMFAFYILAATMVPTRPRNKKRREVSAPSFAWSPA